MASNKGMSREEAHQLYDSLKSAMEAKYGKRGLAALIAEDKKKKSASAAAGGQTAPRPAAKAAKQSMPAAAARPRLAPAHRGAGGQKAALAFIVVVALAKITLSGLEASGVLSVPEADAALSMPQPASYARFDEQETNILKSLDERRVALEERGRKLEEREEELERRDREFAARLTQLRDLSERLKLDREKNEKKRSGQLDQLAAVYGSMNPQEAAQLLEQLDVTISLSLIERMPEKRIGQILALMSPERALTLTQMLSTSKAGA